MSLLNRGGRGVQKRALGYQDVWGAGHDPIDLLGSSLVESYRVVPLFAAHRKIIDGFSATPLHAYRQHGAASERLPRQPRMLTDPVFGTPATWRAQYIASLLSDGNAFGLHIDDPRTGWPGQIAWLMPHEVEIDETDPLRPDYYWRGRALDRAELTHIPWLVPPGRFRGISPLRTLRIALETGMSAQSTARDWFLGGAIPSGHFKNTARVLNGPQANRAKGRFRAAVSGRDVLVTGSDWEYNAIGVPADEARFFEALGVTATQIAAFYGLAPEDIGGTRGQGASLRYATLEMDDLKFNQVLAPYAVKLEYALDAISPRGVFHKANLDANVRADLKTRMEAHEIAERAGLETLDEARAVENKAPMTDDEYARWRETWHPAKPGPTETTTGSTGDREGTP